jgi:hypothetical protein
MQRIRRKPSLSKTVVGWVLKQRGIIDPENIREYITDGGYIVAKKLAQIN